MTSNFELSEIKLKYFQDEEYDNIDNIDVFDMSVNNNLLKEGEIINPFFVDYRETNLKDISWGDIYRNYNSVIILTLQNGKIIDDKVKKIFEYGITNDDLINQNSITYFRASLDIIKNSDNYKKTNIVSKNNLNLLFTNGDFNEYELVLLMFEMNEYNSRIYCNMYNSNDELSDIELKSCIYNYYLSDKKNNNYIDTDNLIKNLKTCDYWTKNDNLNFNVTSEFVNREFNNQKTKYSIIQERNEKKESIIKIVKKGNVDYPINNEPDNHENIDNNNDDINKQSVEIKQYNSKKFNDLCESIKFKENGSKRSFNSIIDSKYNNEFINNIFNNISNDKFKYNFINNLLVSKDYCHLVLNNKDLLIKLKSMFDIYSLTFKYTIGYAWLSLYLDECFTRINSKKTSRFSFDINTAHHLPIFPYLLTDLKQNPYLPVLINNKEIIIDNAYGISYIPDYNGYGVCNLETFKKRFNIFTSGDVNINPLNGLDWTNFAVSGSLIPACLQKTSPLLNNFIKKEQDTDKAFLKFIEEYYNDSDIDLMSNETSLYDFLKSVQTVYDLLKTNLNATEKDCKYEVVKNFAISISEHFFTDYLDDFNKFNNSQLKKEEFEAKVDNIIFKLYIYNKYIEVKNIVNKNLINKNVDTNNKFIAEYFIPNSFENMTIYKVDSNNYDNYSTFDTEILYKRNDINNNKLSDIDNKMVIKFSENFRFKLFCKNTKIEMFRVRDKDFYSTVSRFHFPCVRAYYQGDNVHILPSCISAMMTGLNIEYKYFAGIRNPNEIINKYMTRGFGVLLNKYEIDVWLKYNESNENKYKNFKKNNMALCGNIIGQKNIHNIVYNENTNTELQNNNTKHFDNDDLKKYYYKCNNVIDPLKMTTISQSGNINKYKQSFVDLCYDLIN